MNSWSRAAAKPAWITSALGDILAGGGTDWLVYHCYDAFDNGDAWVQIRPLTWAGGWPVTAQALVPVPGQAGPPGSRAPARFPALNAVP